MQDGLVFRNCRREKWLQCRTANCKVITNTWLQKHTCGYEKAEEGTHRTKLTT